MFFEGGFEELFGGMGGMHGHPGMGGMPRKPKGDTSKLYNILGVEKKATQVEIRKAYRKLARTHHPDRGGDAEEFKKVQNAYDCLNDPGKRKAYDLTGDPDADPRTVAAYGGGRRKKKGRNTSFELAVPMEQFYNGYTRKIKVTKTVLCPTCDGAGGSGVSPCNLCRGRGVRVVDRQIGPGMIQRMQMQCNNCDGKGEVIPRGQRCKSCNASGTSKEGKVLSVFIQKGMKHGEKVVFDEEGDQHPDETPGDVVVILKKKPHPRFKRTPNGCHLIYRKQISLLEALTGFEFSIEHLDERILHVTSKPGVIYKSGDIKAIREEGFPLRGDPMTRGHLYVHLEVVFPENLTAAQQQGLKDVLGAPAPVEFKSSTGDNTDIEKCVLEEVDIEAEKAAYKKLLADSNQYDSDDEGGMHGGQQMACRQQ